jgi:hypothetical protein
MQGDGYIGPTALRTDRLLAAAQVGQGGTIVRVSASGLGSNEKAGGMSSGV